jgi:hypothetical protein
LDLEYGTSSKTLVSSHIVVAAGKITHSVVEVSYAPAPERYIPTSECYDRLDMFISEEDMQKMQEQLENYPDLLPDASFEEIATDDLYGLLKVPQLEPQLSEQAPQHANHPVGTGIEDTEVTAPPTPGPSGVNNNDGECGPGHELPDYPEEEQPSGSTSLGKLLAEKQRLGADQMIQLPRSRPSTKVPKATRQAVTDKRREKAARFQVALEKIREKIDTEISEVASRFDMKVEDVSCKLQHDTRWASKKRAPNIWNAVVHAQSVLMHDGEESPVIH